MYNCLYTRFQSQKKINKRRNACTVAQKTAPMFVCFSKMFIVWMTETANKSE